MTFWKCNYWFLFNDSNASCSFWKWFLIIICKIIIYYVQNFKDICPVCSKTTRITKYKTRGFPHWSIMRQLFKISVLWKSQHVSNMDISLDYWIFSWVVAEVEHTIAKSTKMYSSLIWQHGILLGKFFFSPTFLSSLKVLRLENKLVIG